MAIDLCDRRFDPSCCDSTSFFSLPRCVRVFPGADGPARRLSDCAGLSGGPSLLQLLRMAAGPVTGYHGRPRN
jgi:hypothetical protein